MSIKQMIKKVSGKDIKASAEAVKRFEGGSSKSQMIMIAFD
jgi:hypothetical protein